MVVLDLGVVVDSVVLDVGLDDECPRLNRGK